MGKGTTSNMHEQPPEPVAIDNQAGFFSILFSWRASNLFFTASKLGVFDCLSQGYLTAAQVAERCGCALYGIEILLNTCVTLGLVEKHGNQYRNSPAADEYLVTGKPNSLQNFVSLQSMNFNIWVNLDEAVRSNTPVNLMSEQIKDDEPVARTAAAGLCESVMILGRDVAESIDFKGRHRLFVTGPAGVALAIIALQKAPGLRATVLEQAPMVDIGREYIARHSLANSIELKPGDYSEDSFGQGNDAVILSQLLELNDKEMAKRTLKKAYDSLVSGGLLAIFGYATESDKIAPVRAAIQSLHLLLISNGGEAHSTVDYKGWLEETGFLDATVHQHAGPLPFTLITAIKK